LASREYFVGLLDVDICGPSVPYMCGVEGEEVHQSVTGWYFFSFSMLTWTPLWQSLKMP